MNASPKTNARRPRSDTTVNEAPRIGIVVSRDDRASEHIGNALLDLADWRKRGEALYLTEGFELRVYDDLHLDLEDVATDFTNPSFLVFVSRHSGETGALLSAHFTGNFGEAAYGGEDRTLAPACPSAQKTVLNALAAHAPDQYEVTLECTHHGPSDPGAPSMFVELGSGDEQWDDPQGARAVARAVLDLQGVEPHAERTFVSFGGSHYAPRPTRIVQDTDWACGHVAADWGLDDLGAPSHHPGVVEQAFTQSNARYATVEGDRPDLAATIEDLGYRVVSETWLRETAAVPLPLVNHLEQELASVDAGLRFGDHARDTTEEDIDYVVIDLPDELVADASGVDMDAITAAARSTSVAYETRENGNRVAGRAAFISGTRYESFLDSVCEVLEREYEQVERTEDVIIVHEQAFDPERAAKLGVPEGPAFGALANGESVDVDGRTIHPSDVTVGRTRRYPR